LVDPDYKGEDYCIDAALENGPLRNRRCTDVLCLIIFAVAAAAGCYVGIYAVANGDPLLIIAPYDADGNFCGKSPGYEDYPYLWFENLSYGFWLPWGVCVQSCPTVANPIPECIPAGLADTCDPKPEAYDSRLFIDRFCVPVYDSLPVSLEGNYNDLIGSYGLDDLELYVRDIRESWIIYLIAIPSIFVLIFIWNLCLRLFAEILVWVSIILVGFMIAALGFGIMFFAGENYPPGD
jgi:solute carrier family 44 (choline transporter-like protein), member 2/4/5